MDRALLWPKVAVAPLIFWEILLVPLYLLNILIIHVEWPPAFFEEFYSLTLYYMCSTSIYIGKAQQYTNISRNCTNPIDLILYEMYMSFVDLLLKSIKVSTSSNKLP